jgi:hypothetical protein
MTQDEIAAIVDGIAPVVRDYVKSALAEVHTRVQVLDVQLAGLVTATTEIGTMRERLATLETRPPTPGPPGQDGAPGPAGQDGADGKPGLEWCGVFVDGQTYDRGQLVTWAGAAWHCNESTPTKPGEGSKAWTLMVKRGRDGKDGKDGAVGPAGPTGRDWQQVYEDTRRR